MLHNLQCIDIAYPNLDCYNPTAAITHKCLVCIAQTGFFLRLSNSLAIAAGIDILLCKFPDVLVLHRDVLLSLRGKLVSHDLQTVRSYCTAPLGQAPVALPLLYEARVDLNHSSAPSIFPINLIFYLVRNINRLDHLNDLVFHFDWWVTHF